MVIDDPTLWNEQVAQNEKHTSYSPARSLAIVNSVVTLEFDWPLTGVITNGFTIETKSILTTADVQAPPLPMNLILDS
jgi:hypothetical protein